MSGPYGVAARTYFDSGWSPVPLPPRSKWPPATGYTGASGKFLDELTLKRWLKAGASVSAGDMSWTAGSGNIALRLPATVIGIDVDMYGDKEGRATFEKAIEAWGPLPDSWYTTSRSDGSGIRLYRIPEGLSWPGGLPQGGGVELVRWDHRFAIVAPSIHDRTGETYRWYREENGEARISPESFPDPGELPDLPEAWVEGLTSGRRWTDRSVADLDEQDVRNWLSDRPSGPECGVMARTLAKYQRELREKSDDGGVHDAGRNGAWAVIGDAAAGHAGVTVALARLRKTFMKAVAHRADARLAAEEWSRIVIRGVQKVAAEGEPANGDICALLDTGGSAGGDGPSGDGAPPARGGSSTYDYTRDDVGNAQRFVVASAGEVKYTDAFGGWMVWDAELRRWRLDDDGEIRRRTIQVVRGMDGEAEFIEDLKEKAAFKKFIRASGNIGKLDAMEKVARGMKGIVVGADVWDSDPKLLATPQEVIALSRSRGEPPVSVRPILPDRYMTLSTAAHYDPEAESPEWDAFLDRFQPDPEIRIWLQKLVGYSLQGGNPERLFIVCFGKTSTGKTTFAEVMQAVLGSYAGATNLTIFRDNQDERARADLVRVINRRIVFAEEASAEWHLHPDQIKRLTGGSKVTARLPFAKTYVEKRPAFTPWLMSNASPSIVAADAALWRRTRVIPWGVQIKEGAEDVEYGARLASPENAPGVLAWIVRGWEMYVGDPDLSVPAGALDVLSKFRSGASDLDEFMSAACDTGEEFWELPATLYAAYRMWCTDNGIAGKDLKSNTVFGRFLSGIGIDRIMRRVEIDGETVPRYVRSGVRLNDSYRKLVP